MGKKARLIVGSVFGVVALGLCLASILLPWWYQELKGVSCTIGTRYWWYKGYLYCSSCDVPCPVSGTTDWRNDCSGSNCPSDITKLFDVAFAFMLLCAVSVVSILFFFGMRLGGKGGLWPKYHSILALNGILFATIAIVVFAAAWEPAAKDDGCNTDCGFKTDSSGPYYGWMLAIPMWVCFAVLLGLTPAYGDE